MINEFVVTKAESSDIEELNQISFQSKKYWDYPEEWLEKWLPDLTVTPEDIEKHHYYKLVTEKKIIGFCAITETEEEYEIVHLWVKPEFIGKGFGKLLLNETLKKAVTKALPVIVTADPNAEAFYASQGFITFDKEESYPKGRFLPVMRKSE